MIHCVCVFCVCVCVGSRNADIWWYFSAAVLFCCTGVVAGEGRSVCVVSLQKPVNLSAFLFLSVVVCHTCWCRLLCVCGGGGKTGCRKCRLLADVMVCVWGAGNTEFFICPSVVANTTHSCSVADCYSATWACPDTLRPTGAPLTALWGCGSTRSLTFHNKPPRRYVTHRLPTKVQEVTRAPSSKIPRCALEFCSSVGKALTWPPQNGEIFDFTPQSLRWQRWFFLRSDIHWGAFSGS